VTKILVIIPTYNETENIGKLIDCIFEACGDVDILVVDDDSPDGTAYLVREKQKQYGEKLRLKVRTEGKAGRGSACLYAFKVALDENYDCAIEMDADFSHDPIEIPKMIRKIEEYDVVVGSKYMKGAKIEGWNWFRKLLSRGANFYARLILGIPISDYTNGYRCYGRRALEIIPEFKFEGKGFTVIPQMSYQLYKAGMKFTEIPITFVNRREGKSNMTFKEIIESFTAIPKIRFRK
jgi:dolichol-phosphate mannosyltransferase